MTETQTQQTTHTQELQVAFTMNVNAALEHVSTLERIVSETAWAVSREGVQYKSVDPAHVTMVEGEIPRHALDGFIVETTGVPIEVSMSTKPVLLALKTIKSLNKNAEVTFRWLTIDSKRTLELSGAGCVQTFQCPTGVIVPKVPKMHEQSTHKMDTKEAIATLRACAKLSDHVKIESFENGQLAFTSTHADNDEKFNAELFTYAPYAKPTVSKYSLDYLKSILGSVKAKRISYVSHGTDYPCSWSWENRVGRARMLLAPRIETD